MTFGLDDIYDENAESTYGTYDKNKGPKKSKYQPRENKERKDNKVVKEVVTEEKPKKLLGGWEDQGALRMAWDTDEN